MQLDLNYFQPSPNEALQEIKLIHNYHSSQKIISRLRFRETHVFVSKRGGILFLLFVDKLVYTSNFKLRSSLILASNNFFKFLSTKPMLKLIFQSIQI